MTCFTAAVLLIFFLFADVLFLRTSLAPLDYTDVLKDPDKTSAPASLLPERPYRNVGHGIGDIGSAVYQFEPSILFLAHCLRTGESPYWDPYTAAGTIGPETVDDIKFSPFSVTVALLGGSSRVFTFVLLVLYVCSCYCFLRACTEYLQLSFAASLGACFAFFLSGFVFANFFTAIGQPYFLSPVLLLASLAVIRNASRLNLALCLAAYVAFFATTFFPTMVLCGLTTYGIVFAQCVKSDSSRTRFLRTLLSCAIPIAALCLLAFLYVPAVTASLTYLTDLNIYKGRQTPGFGLINLISLFSPKHIWETQRAFSIPAKALPGDYDMEVQFLGITASLLAIQAFATRRSLRDPLVIVLGVVVLTTFGQAFSVPPFTLIDKLPFFSFIRNTYWMAPLTLAWSFLAGIGIDNLKRARFLPTVMLAAVIAISFFVAYRRVGLIDVPWELLYVSTFWILLLAGCVLTFLARFSRWATPVLVVVLFCEGVFYMNGLRPHRESRDTHLAVTLAWVKSKLHGAGDGRILNVGDSGITPNWGAALGVPQLGDLNSIGAPSWYQDFFYNHIGQGLFESIRNPSDKSPFTDESLSLAGVRYVIVDRAFTNAISRVSSFGYPLVNADFVRLIYENPHPLPRAFIVHNIFGGNALPENVRTAITTDDGAFVQEARSTGMSLGNTSGHTADAASTAKLLSYHNALVKIQTNMQTPGVLVLTDTWTPWWSASVDGRAAQVGRVDITFRAVAVPAGSHMVEFRYAPLPLEIGRCISALTAILVGLLLWRWKDPPRLSSTL